MFFEKIDLGKFDLKLILFTMEFINGMLQSFVSPTNLLKKSSQPRLSINIQAQETECAVFVLFLQSLSLTETWNYIDIILGILLLLAAINRFSQRFCCRTCFFCRFNTGDLGCYPFFPILPSDYLVKHFDYTSKHLGVISFLITFIVIVILVYMVGKSGRQFCKSSTVGIYKPPGRPVFWLCKIGFNPECYPDGFSIHLMKKMRILPAGSKRKLAGVRTDENAGADHLSFCEILDRKEYFR